jgi:hypothetical protein
MRRKTEISRAKERNSTDAAREDTGVILLDIIPRITSLGRRVVSINAVILGATKSALAGVTKFTCTVKGLHPIQHACAFRNRHLRNMRPGQSGIMRGDFCFADARAYPFVDTQQEVCVRALACTCPFLLLCMVLMGSSQADHLGKRLVRGQGSQQDGGLQPSTLCRRSQVPSHQVVVR